ncbi:hypothetical protein BI362_01545 [Streptococcus parauberis]|uniref:Uncharacterized protein n=1 Tax=Streptococcus parauberis TaxID=1348 RepID=A0AAE4HUJ3_9STRE|nr:hypothetical protein [Streptococcus parauberis]MDT2731014.1 hypothetical protein [Streptococcus parauberis]MDT2749720.1 hypothetical protein [Streptococcus parauberis]OHY31041.1 hypothetical protein BI362_01545 [Streptococcus parauberis]
MFILINQATDNSERFETKFDLLNRLDNASERCKNLDIRETYSIRQVDENGVIKEKTSLTLPLMGYADEFLIDFGNTKPKNKRFSFTKGKRGKDFSHQKDDKTVSSDNQSRKPSVQPSEETKQSPKKDRTSSASKESNNIPSAKANTLKGFLLIGCIVFLGVFQTYSMIQNQSLKTQVNQVVSRQEKIQSEVDFQKQVPGIDTFSRYFIPSYFSGKKEVVKPFYSKKIRSKGLVGDTRKLQSVILKDVKKDRDKAKVTYLLVVMNGDSKHSIKLTFDIERANNGQYDYQVVSIPIEH